MKSLRKVVEPTEIQLEITRVHESLAKIDPTTPEYKSLNEQLAKLYDMQKTLPVPDAVSKDVVVGGLFSLGGILSVLAFEKLGNGIIVTKALSILPKMRI